MLDSYADIRERIPEPPKWWDRHGCPRYSDPVPKNCSHVYADRLAFMRIACQACGTEFLVEFASSRMDRILWARTAGKDPLEEQPWEPETLHYGDPPSTGCCAAGDTMNSCPRELVAAYEKERFDWKRTHANVAVRADWDTDDG